MTGEQSFEHLTRAIAWVRNERAGHGDDDWGGVESVIELASHMPDESLLGLGAFSHVQVLFVFHKVSGEPVYGARRPRGRRELPSVGIFAQRAKRRPNAIGLTTCRIVSVEPRRVHVLDLDALDGTPVIDLKPYLEEFAPKVGAPGETTCQPQWTRNVMARYWHDPST